MTDDIDFIKESDEKRKEFYKTQESKNLYLGEYKERVIAALTKSQVLEDDAYEEIFELMESKDAYILKMARELKLENLKPYIKHAEEIKLKYELVDGLTYHGNIGLVIAAKTALEKDVGNPLVRDMDQDFTDAGLSDNFSKARGKKICSECHAIISEKIPEYEEEFMKAGFLDKLTGLRCPICKQKC